MIMGGAGKWVVKSDWSIVNLPIPNLLHNARVLCVSLCRGVDQKLKLLLDDANHYIRPQDSAADAGDGPFDRFANKKQITDFLQNACESCITKYVCHVTVSLLLQNRMGLFLFLVKYLTTLFL